MTIDTFEKLAIQILGQEEYDNSPCQAHPGELIEVAFTEMRVERDRLRARLAEIEGQEYSKKGLYAAFDAWVRQNPSYDLDTRLHTHGGPIEHGGYISHSRTAAAFTAFCAGAKAYAAPVAVPEKVTELHCPVSLYAPEVSAKAGWAKGWNDCREAMLSADPKGG